MSELKTAKDLQRQYDLNKKWMALLPGKRPVLRGSIEAILRYDCVNMAERIDRAETALAEANKEGA